MTDERQGDALWPALERLPRGAGVIFRHYSLSSDERKRLFAAIERVCRRRGLILVRAGNDAMHKEQGKHGRSLKRVAGLCTWSAHKLRDVIAGRRAGADAIFISPVFATRSHPGQPPLGVVRASRLAQAAGGRAIALGGVNQQSFRRLQGTGFIGWAAIDGLSGVSALNR